MQNVKVINETKSTNCIIDLASLTNRYYKQVIIPIVNEYIIL
jgi:hypothetical protein